MAKATFTTSYHDGDETIEVKQFVATRNATERRITIAPKATEMIELPVPRDSIAALAVLSREPVEPPLSILWTKDSGLPFPLDGLFEVHNQSDSQPAEVHLRVFHD